MEDVNTSKTIFLSLCKLGRGPQEFNSSEIHLYKDVFAAVAVVVGKASNKLIKDTLRASCLVNLLVRPEKTEKLGPFIREEKKAAVYITLEGNHLYEYSVHKTRASPINGSRLSSSRPDRTNDDVVPRVIWSNGSSEQKSEAIGFGQENRHILHCLFRFK